jgi:hypothetical protein
LFFICCFFVLLSIAIHGGSLMFLKHEESRPLAAALTVVENAPTNLPGQAASRDGASAVDNLISIPEMKAIQQSGAPNLILDVRAERSFGASDLRAQGAVRISPDRAVESLKQLGVSTETWLFAFCA